MLILNFFKYSSADRRLLIKSGIYLWLVRLGLWLLPFRTLRRLVAKMKAKSRVVEGDDITPKKTAWGVKMASRFVPDSTCLAQALTAQVLLGRLGQSCNVRIGVAKNEGGKLEAHAWLESKGQVIIGRTGDLSRFAQLPYQE